MKYAEYLQKHDVYDETYKWILDDRLENKKCIYVWEFVMITTSAIYILLQDESSRDIVAADVEVINYTNLNHLSIGNKRIRKHVKEVLLLEKQIGLEYTHE